MLIQAVIIITTVNRVNKQLLYQIDFDTAFLCLFESAT